MSWGLWGLHTAAQGGGWYHVTHQKLSPGDRITPGGGKSSWTDDNAFSDRGNHVWLSDDDEHVGYWLAQFQRGEGMPHLYEVDPDQPPAPYDADDSLAGHVTSGATVLRQHEPLDFMPWLGGTHTAVVEADVADDLQRLAMPNPLPQGVHFRYHPELMWSPGVTAHQNGKMIGSLEWYHDDHIMVDLGTRKPGEIDRISVDPKHQGNSVASSMFDFAKQHEPRLHHSDRLTPDGEGWSAYEKSRHAAVTQNLVDRLHDEFHQWWHGTGQTPHPGADPERGPIGHWPHVEQFLFEKYPMAHLGLDMGNEEAAPVMDGNTIPYLQGAEYETGPAAVSEHGYDPKEIAAGMVLLHNQSHPLRGDLAQEDQARLNDIFDKRVKMQRNYEQRNARLAGKNGPPPPMTFEPFNTMWSNGIMARHADDGRPIAHLHWHPDGEIETIRVHPELQGRDIAKHVLAHAATHPETFEARQGIKPSNNLTNAGRAFARSLGHDPSDEEIVPADDDVTNWGWTAVDNYTPMHIPYTGQNEDEMSHHLDKPWTPPERTANTHGNDWPVWWRGRTHPDVPWDKRWHPNHPQHVPGPWDQ